ncbi:MAG: DUF1893 domain-containing protein [Clostridiales bacterium]|nr:DUF1893 domain-containing protein [Clostridiales bacterium]
MRTDLENARLTLEQGGYTCVLCREGETFTGTEHGVRPLMSWLRQGADLRGCSAADRVVGRAAAYLYALLGVKVVHGMLMSEGGRQVLEDHGVQASWDTLVPEIRNRTNTGLCPMEQAVRAAHTPEEAYQSIAAAIARMQTSKGTT